MILIIYIPVRKIAFFFLESLFIGGMMIVGAYLRFLGDPQASITMNTIS